MKKKKKPPVRVGLMGRYSKDMPWNAMNTGTLYDRLTVSSNKSKSKANHRTPKKRK
jgi:hypothetical protein